MVNLIDSLRQTSSAASPMTASAAGTGVLASIFGVDGTPIRVQRVSVWATVATAAVYGCVVLTKRTAVGSSGTATTLTNIAHNTRGETDSGPTVKFYTVLGTAGTGGGVIATGVAFMPITGTPATIVQRIDLEPNNGLECDAWVLNSAAEGLELSFAATTTNAPTVAVQFTWTKA